MLKKTYLWKTLLLGTFFCVAGAVAVFAQMKNDHVQWELLTTEVSGKPGEVVTVQVRADIVSDVHMYSTRVYDDVLGPAPTVITAGSKETASVSGPVSSDVPPILKYDPNFELETEFWKSRVTFTIPVKIADDAEVGAQKAWVNFHFMTCNSYSCRPPTDERLEFVLNVAGK